MINIDGFIRAYKNKAGLRFQQIQWQNSDATGREKGY
jgi:hypothetical protein